MVRDAFFLLHHFDHRHPVDRPHVERLSARGRIEQRTVQVDGASVGGALQHARRKLTQIGIGVIDPFSHGNQTIVILLSPSVILLSLSGNSQHPMLYSGFRHGYSTMITHPKGTRARVLFSSVFGPYAQDDEFGSRKINPMELYHNQVTREQGPFSLRMFHRSWGILMIQQNISAPTTVLDFPTQAAFEAELAANEYDIVGISSIIVNVGKVREMCKTIRRLAPQATIVIGGHVAARSEERRVGKEG